MMNIRHLLTVAAITSAVALPSQSVNAEEGVATVFLRCQTSFTRRTAPYMIVFDVRSDNAPTPSSRGENCAQVLSDLLSDSFEVQYEIVDPSRATRDITLIGPGDDSAD